MGDRNPPGPDATTTIDERDGLIAELQRDNREHVQFAHVVSHDLSAPLRAISGFLGLLDRKYGATLDETASDYVRRSADAAAHMRTLLDDVLALAEIRSAPRRVEVDCDALVARCIAELETQLTVRAERDGDAWRFSVADNGIGIDPRFRARIFTMFRRLHGSHPGTGVGLTICRRAVEAMGGTIRVEGAEGPGSVLTFTVPDAPTSREAPAGAAA